MISFGNNELAAMPEMKKSLQCPHCNKRHKIKEGKDTDGCPAGLFFYNCGDKTYLCGVQGKDITQRFKKT